VISVLAQADVGAEHKVRGLLVRAECSEAANYRSVSIVGHAAIGGLLRHDTKQHDGSKTFGNEWCEMFNESREGVVGSRAPLHIGRKALNRCIALLVCNE
jgi:hypothetical protein